MLLQFTTKNFKSFVDEMIFSMRPAHGQKGLDYSVQSQDCGNKTYKSISCAVIYGPNASGKTNVIGAMDTLKEIVLRGNIRNADIHSPNFAASYLDLIPNCNMNAGPTEFSICFADGNVMVEYCLKMDLGSFMDRNYERKILEERLSVNEKEVFIRTEAVLDVFLPSVIKPFVNKSIKRRTPKMLELA